MPSVHVVKRGECLATIAQQHGFADYRAIYDHESNAALREKRPNPHVIFEGDRVVIPDRAAKAVKVPTTKRHTFELKRGTVFLRLDVMGHVEGDVVQARYELRLDDSPKPIEGTIGEDGKLDVEVSAEATRGELTLRDPDTDEIIDVIEIRLGALDPETTVTGIRSRLLRLGFDCGGETGEMGAMTRGALAMFQRVYGIDEDGEPGPRTRAKLVQLVGA